MFAGASLDENSGAFCELKANFFRLILTKAELLALSFSDFDMSGNLLHINKTYNWIIPYVTDWKGKGMDTRVSLKQVLKSLGFQGVNKHDTELNQWMNHEKKVLAEIAKQHGIEWEQKGTHEEHLNVQYLTGRIKSSHCLSR